MVSFRQAEQPGGSAYSPPGEGVGRGLLISCARATREPYLQKEVKVEVQVEQRSIRLGVFSASA